MVVVWGVVVVVGGVGPQCEFQHRGGQTHTTATWWGRSVSLNLVVVVVVCRPRRRCVVSFASFYSLDVLD